ncbi:CHAT domain-containing protein [Maribacter sp. MAR_2009_72]|uniref:CHAT domain-containing protein n=1 Tax=Maribacter sp. MAR_2009_72 TaxID=1250050 RepID=UPI00119BB4DF|nr:CHAT domain-containing protein [Maribacter sp. MAR_2009_72]TVZ13957.1 CHAT domain-containing protein [Maribacter sp. MAR_2009_72]
MIKSLNKLLILFTLVLIPIFIFGQNNLLSEADSAILTGRELMNNKKINEAFLLVNPIKNKIIKTENLNELDVFLKYYNLHLIELSAHASKNLDMKLSEYVQNESNKVKHLLDSEHLKWFYYMSKTKSILFSGLLEGDESSVYNLNNTNLKLQTLKNEIETEKFNFKENKDDLIKYISIFQNINDLGIKQINGELSNFNKEQNDSYNQEFLQIEKDLKERVLNSYNYDLFGLGYDKTGYKIWINYLGITKNKQFIIDEIKRLKLIISNGFYTKAINKSEALLQRLNRKDFNNIPEVELLEIFESIILNIHSAHLKLQNFDKALYYLNNAKLIYDKINFIAKKSDQRFKYEELYETFYFESGNLNKAIEYAQIQLSHGNYYEPISGNIALYYKFLGEYSKAIEYQKRFNKWIKIENKKYNSSYPLSIDLFLADLYVQNQQYDLASLTLETLKNKINIAIAKKSNPTDLSNNSDFKTNLKDYFASLDIMESDLIKLCYANLAITNESIKNESTADEYMLKYLQGYSYDFFDYLLNSIESSRQKSIDDNLYNSNLIFYFLSKKEKNSGLVVGGGYNVALLSKSLLLNTSNLISQTVSKSQNSTLKSLDQRLKTVKKSLKEIDTEKKDSLMDYARYYEKQILKYAKEDILVNLNNSIKTWNDVQNQLKDGEAAIEFIKFKPYYFEKENQEIYYAAFILKKNIKTPIFVNLFEEKEINKIIETSQKNSYNEKDKISKLYNLGGDNLYNLIWEPIEKKLNGINKIYFSPAGILNKISFSTLRKKESFPSLGEQYKLFQLISTKDISKITIAEKINNAAIFGDITYNSLLTNDLPNQQEKTIRSSIFQELPGTKKEIDELEQILKLNKIEPSIYSNIHASEENIRKVLQENQIDLLHIATHAFYLPPIKKEETSGSYFLGWSLLKEDNDPMNRSGIALSGANEFWTNGGDLTASNNDGILTANEFSYLNLNNTYLATISACETALGDSGNNEGVFGLQRGLKMAGVQNLLLSLWKVDDKVTEEFMTDFYKNLIDKKLTLQDAHAKTQNKIKIKYKDPYYWASFILIH